MSRAHFCFDEPLWSFLERERRGTRFEYDCARAATGEVVEVESLRSEMGSVPIFLADAHLGGLARFLRMLGGLAARARPFTLCLACNLPLRAVEKAEVAASMAGSHCERMFAALRGCVPELQ